MTTIAKFLESGVLVAAVGLMAMTRAANAAEKTLYTFCSQSSCADGWAPDQALLDDSGNLYGVTRFGGAYGLGAAFELKKNKGGWKYTIIHSFCAQQPCSDGAYPSATLVQDVSGNLYGTASSGGAHGEGTAFELSPSGRRKDWKVTSLYSFCSKGDSSVCLDGENPAGGLTYSGAASGAAYDGTSPLYGATSGGDPDGNGDFGGTVYSLTPVAGTSDWKQKVIYKFCSADGCPNGALPQSTPTFDSAGNLYGTAAYGGMQGFGAVYELKAAKRKWVGKALYAFCQQSQCSDGATPVGGLVMDNMGNLYGTASAGGNQCAIAAGCGVVFEVARNAKRTSYRTLYAFCSETNCADGASPWGRVIIDASGNLFGTTQYGGGNNSDLKGLGGGTVFRLNAGLDVLYSFCADTSCSDGEYPYSGVISDGAGHLFGMTHGSGQDPNGGTIFEVNATGAAR